VRARAVGLLALLGAAIVPAIPADAFVRTMTCREGANPAQDPLACQAGETPQPVFWPRSCVTFEINEDGSSDVDFEEARAAIEASFATWNDVSCSFLQLIPGGLTSSTSVGYNERTPSSNANVVMFRRDSWSHDPRALALTSVTYDLRNGHIVDADIEINDERFNFTTSDFAPLVRIDLRNTVTHEVGHLIGLDHTEVEAATMFAAAPSGELSKRDLHEDDIAGFCTIYPASAAEIPACEPVAESPDDGCACALGATGAPSGFGAWVLGAAMAAAAGLRRRLSRRTT
jgi:MYXO-CTERM domain-containing protein